MALKSTSPFARLFRPSAKAVDDDKVEDVVDDTADDVKDDLADPRRTRRGRYPGGGGGEACSA